VGKAISLINRHIDFVEREILAGTPKSVSPFKKLKWTGSIVNLVELVYALHANKCHGDISLKDLFATYSAFFDIEIKNFSRTFIDIKNRMEGNETIFIDELKNALLHLIMKDIEYSAESDI
jgi:hypothetical protein